MLKMSLISTRLYGRHKALHARRSSANWSALSWLHSGACRSPQSIAVRSQEEMEALGARVADGRRSGDVIFLRGDLGCGKTCFARGFIRAMTGLPTLHVTSPTYLLVNTYDEAAPSNTESPIIHHVDLYRLESVSDVDAAALGLKDAFDKGISLVEWPQRLTQEGTPSERLEVHISYSEEDAGVRRVGFETFGDRWRAFHVDM